MRPSMKKLVVVVAALVACFVPGAGGIHAQAVRPKLVVFIVVDQLRGDYPIRYAGLLQHGLKRLTTQGA